MAFSVFCPECSSALEVEEEHRGWTVRCPHCRHEFRPGSVAPPPEQEPSHFALADEEEDEDEPASEPRRRRRRRRRISANPAAGAQDVQTPGKVLEVIGWISLFLVICMSGFLVFAGIMAEDQMQQQQQQQPPRGQNAKEDPEFFMFMGFCLGIFAVPYFAIIGIGARKMRNLTSYGWAMTSAIMATAAIVLFGVCGLPLIAPGIWAIVALSKEDVKAAFQQKKRRGAYDDNDDEDDE